MSVYGKFLLTILPLSSRLTLKIVRRQQSHSRNCLTSPLSLLLRTTLRNCMAMSHNSQNGQRGLINDHAHVFLPPVLGRKNSAALVSSLLFASQRYSKWLLRRFCGATIATSIGLLLCQSSLPSWFLAANCPAHLVPLCWQLFLTFDQESCN